VKKVGVLVKGPVGLETKIGYYCWELEGRLGLNKGRNPNSRKGRKITRFGNPKKGGV